VFSSGLRPEKTVKKVEIKQNSEKQVPFNSVLGPPNHISTVSFNFKRSQAEINAIFFYPQLPSLAYFN
jgi:hypothetical protein